MYSQLICLSHVLIVYFVEEMETRRLSGNSRKIYRSLDDAFDEIGRYGRYQVG